MTILTPGEGYTNTEATIGLEVVAQYEHVNIANPVYGLQKISAIVSELQPIFPRIESWSTPYTNLMASLTTFDQKVNQPLTDRRQLRLNYAEMQQSAHQVTNSLGSVTNQFPIQDERKSFHDIVEGAVQPINQVKILLQNQPLDIQRTQAILRAVDIDTIANAAYHVYVERLRSEFETPKEV